MKRSKGWAHSSGIYVKSVYQALSGKVKIYQQNFDKILGFITFYLVIVLILHYLDNMPQTWCELALFAYVHHTLGKEKTHVLKILQILQNM